MKIEVALERDTQALAARVAQALSSGVVIGFIGQLGAGKTTFIRHLLRQKGVGADIASPSFVLAHEYAAAGGLMVQHWDLYRASQAPIELLEPPLPNEARLIEWVDKAPELSSMLDLTVTISFFNNSAAQSRVIELSGRLAESCFSET